MYVAVLDCLVFDALARWFSFLRRENVEQSSEQGNPALLLADERSRHDHVVATIKKMPFPLHNREFVFHQVCCSDINGDLLLASVPADEAIDYGMKTNTVRGVARNLMRLIPSGDSHSKLTYYMYVDAGGRIPTFVENAKIPLAIGAVGDLREEFQNDYEIDKLERDQLARVIRDEPQTYTAEENILINKAGRSTGQNQLVYSMKKTPKVIADRDFLGRCVWKKKEREEIVMGYRNELRSFGMKIKPGGMRCFGDNLGQLQNVTWLSSPLKKRHTSIAWHVQRWSQAIGACRLGKIYGKDNLADFVSKANTVADFHHHMDALVAQQGRPPPRLQGEFCCKENAKGTGYATVPTMSARDKTQGSGGLPVAAGTTATSGVTGATDRPSAARRNPTPATSAHEKAQGNEGALNHAAPFR